MIHFSTTFPCEFDRPKRCSSVRWILQYYCETTSIPTHPCSSRFFSLTSVGIQIFTLPSVCAAANMKMNDGHVSHLIQFKFHFWSCQSTAKKWINVRWNEKKGERNRTWRTIRLLEFNGRMPSKKKIKNRICDVRAGLTLSIAYFCRLVACACGYNVMWIWREARRLTREQYGPIGTVRPFRTRFQIPFSWFAFASKIYRIPSQRGHRPGEVNKRTNLKRLTARRTCSTNMRPCKQTENFTDFRLVGFDVHLWLHYSKTCDSINLCSVFLSGVYNASKQKQRRLQAMGHCEIQPM